MQQTLLRFFPVLLLLIAFNQKLAKAQYAYHSQISSESFGLVQLNAPEDIAVDAQGNVYVCDKENHRVQKFDPTGKFLLKFGGKGSSNGQLYNPSGIVVDAQNNVYVLDSYNDRVQKFDASGQFVSKFGTYGSGDGQVASPQGIALDAQGNIYIADTGNDRVQKFSATGQFLSKFGTYGTGDGQFDSPHALAVDANGNVYVLESYRDRVQKFSPTGQFLSKFGTYGSNDGQFSRPEGITLDGQGNIYVVESTNDRVQKFNASHQFLAKVGSYGYTDGKLNAPYGIAVDTQGNLLIADTYNNRIQKLNSSGVYQWQAGSPTGNGQLSFPEGVAVDATGNVYVMDTKNDRVQKFSAAGAFLLKFGSRGTYNGYFSYPEGVAVDAQGNIYTVEAGNDRVQKFSPTGQYLMQLGTYGSADGQLYSPQAVALDVQGNIYVADTYNDRIQKFDPTGKFLLKFGSNGSADGQFDGPTGIALDSQGNIYVTDEGNYRIQKFNAAGQFVMKLGSFGTGDGQFYYPRGITLDGQGNLYVVDTGNDRVQKFNAAGQFVTKIGSEGTANGQFSSPYGVAVDAQGNLFVVDKDNHRIQKFVPVAQPEIAVKAGTTLVTDNSSYSFGTTTTGTPVSVTFTLDNTAGQAALNVSALSLPGGFSLPGPFPTRVAAGATATFTVQMTAETAGNYSGSLSFTTDDADENPYNFYISGSAYPASSPTKTNQTITFNSLPAKSYGEAPFGLSATASSGLAVSYNSSNTSVATVSGSTVTLVGVGTTTITAYQMGNGDYNSASPVSQLLTVTKGTQTITFTPPGDKTFGDAPFALSASASSALPVSFTLVSGPATLMGTTITLTGMGTVTVRATQGGDERYQAATSVEQSFISASPNRREQTITFNAITDKAAGDAPITLEASASSGLPVSFTVVSGPATLSGNTLTFPAAGTVTVKATQAGDASYKAAPEVTQSFCVLPARPVVTASGITLSSSYAEGNQWLLNGEAIAEATGQVYLATLAGSYTVAVSGPCGGKVTSEAFLVTVSAVEPVLAEETRLYPNPAREQVTLELPAGVSWMSASVSDAQGKKVVQLKGNSASKVVIRTQQFPNGLYLLNVLTSKGAIRRKFVVH